VKQFIKIALLVFYVFFNAGLSYSMHYCGDDFQLINFYAESKTCCESEESMPGCCDDVSNLDLPNTDEQQIDILNFHPELNLLSVIDAGFFEFNSCKFIDETVLGFADSSPPFLPGTPIFITNQVFLI
jgi:hypothetical protein